MAANIMAKQGAKGIRSHGIIGLHLPEYLAALVVNYGISNTIVLEIP